jgi:hypothetical protein
MFGFPVPNQWGKCCMKRNRMMRNEVQMIQSVIKGAFW